MPIDLTAEEVACVRRIIREYVPDAEVWAFGSRVTGTRKRHSDLDLAILSSTPLPARQIALLVEDLADSDLPFRVDVVDWATTSESFRRRITEAHEVLLRRNERCG